jgi:hypothetical protein
MKARETGSALVETVLVALLFMVPLIWLLGVLADMHRGALASTAAAREAGADAARATSIDEAERAVDAAVAQAFIDHGLNPSDAEVSWTASNDFERGAAVEIEVSYPVTVLQAPLLGRVAGPSVEVSARHVARIDPFRSRR